MNINQTISIRTLESFSFYQKIDYFYNTCEGSIIFHKDGIVNVRERSIYILKYILKMFCYSLKNYNETAYKVLKTKYNNPVVVNKNISLVATSNINSYENIWINIANVKQYNFINNKLNLIFYSGNKLVIRKDVEFLKKQLDKIDKMKTYLFNVRFYI